MACSSVRSSVQKRVNTSLQLSRSERARLSARRKLNKLSTKRVQLVKKVMGRIEQ
jgi:hypothetical protein